MLKLARAAAVLTLLAAAVVGSGFALEAYLQQADIDCSAEYQKTSDQKEHAEIDLSLNHLVPPERRHTDPAPPKETRYECLIAKYTIQLATFTKILAYATAGLVIATIGLLVLGFFQALDMKESVAAAKKSAKAAEDGLLKLQRAFVTFQGLRYLSHVGADKKVWWSVQFNWFNSGSSPAKRVRLFASKYFEDVDLPPDFKFEAPIDRPTNSMGPRSAMHVGGLSLNADELRSVREGKKFLYFWGRADYRDIFDNSPDHITKFSIRVIDFRGDPSKYWNDKTNIVELITNTSPSRHNCADEDCNQET